MALQLIGSIDDGKVELHLDVVDNRVVAVSCSNGSSRTARVAVSRASGQGPVAEETVAPGATATRNLPNNRRFDYDSVLADWSYAITQEG